MKKETSCAFGKRVYLLGEDVYGTRYWLEEAKWECDWYWGLGYVETYTDNKRPSRSCDISSHQHFNGMFFHKGRNGYDVFRETFHETPLKDKEVWQLLELMKALYTLREYSDLLTRGGAHYTTNPCKNIIVNNVELERINKKVIPALLSNVYALLTPDEEEDHTT